MLKVIRSLKSGFLLSINYHYGFNLSEEIQKREEEDEGEGMQKIFISPNSSDRIKRAFVLLGQRKSSMEDNPDTLAEFTTILDSMMTDGKLPVRAYRVLMKKWN